jgi:hypothetical protein
LVFTGSEDIPLSTESTARVKPVPPVGRVGGVGRGRGLGIIVGLVFGGKDGFSASLKPLGDAFVASG